MEWVIAALAAAGAGLGIYSWRLRRRLAPLDRLVDSMEKVDLARPRANLPADLDGIGETEEVARIEQAFLRMLERLESERRSASRAALRAQEEERARVARDLHDEVNQALTGVLLHLEAARAKAPEDLVGELAETKALASQAMDELLSLARQLRPAALDDLGLLAALAGHVEDFERRTGIRARFRSEGEVNRLPDDVQLVLYRVTQEALSNAARHSGATQVDVDLRRNGDGVKLTVTDDGRGFSFDEAGTGLGLAGMRERALHVGGELRLESSPGRGTKIGLTIP
jgi:two-component system, NarL family, sensor histidine kinase UhpB